MSLNFTQVLRVLADHVHVAEDVREELHGAIDALAAERGEPARAKVVADAEAEAKAREVADLQARLAALTDGDVKAPEGA